MKTNSKLILLPLLALALAIPVRAQQGPPSERFPADTFAYLELDSAALDRGLRQLDLAGLLEDPEFTDFLLPLLGRIGADPARPLDSLLEKASIRQFLGGSAAIGLRGLKIQIQHPDGGETRVEISPNKPVAAEGVFDLAGLFASVALDGDWNPAELEYEAGLDLALVLDPGPALVQRVRGALQAPGKLAWIVTRIDAETLSGRRVTHVTLNAMATRGIITDVWADLEGSRWMLATSRSTFEQMAVLSPEDSLGGSGLFRSIRQQVSAVDPVLFYFSDLAKEMSILRNFIPPIAHEMLDASGLSSLRGGGLAVSITDGGVRESVGIALDGEPGGFWRLLEAMPGGLESLKKAPADAMGLVSLKFDAAILLDRLEGLMGALLPGTEKRIEPKLAAAARQVGIDLRADILSTLGDEITLVQYAPKSMMAVPDWVLLVKLKDEAGMSALLGKIETMAREADAPVSFQPFELEGATLARRIVMQGLPMLPPSLAVQNGHLIAASRADLITSAATEWGSDAARTLAGGNESFQQTMRGLTGGELDNAAMLLFLDLRALLPPVLGATVGMMPPEFVDTSFYPDVQLLAAHFSGVAVAMRRDGEGMTIDSFSPTGMVIPALLMGMRRASGERRADDARALNNEAWSMVKDPGHDLEHYARGLQLAEVANQLEPGNHYFLNTLGVAQYRLGRYEAVLATLERSDELNQRSPDAYNRASDLLFMAMAHWKLGNAERARELLVTSENLVAGAGSEDLAGFLEEARALMAPLSS